MSSGDTLHDGLLLLGPTGAGKSPLGDALAATGLAGRRCHHFDFGSALRAAVAGTSQAVLTVQELAFLREVLATGALLEDDRFYLAARLLQGFLRERGVAPGDWLVLNGLPRHAGQAETLTAWVRVVAVVELACDAATVHARLRADAAGDRAGRRDDDLPLVARKLALYAERTAPLVAWYRARGVPIVTVPVSATATGPELAARLPAGLSARR
jgi:adenylate kinase family enzyme